MKLFSKLFIFDILVHIVFLFTILYSFFFLVGINEERNNMQKIFKNTSKNTLNYIKKNNKEEFNNFEKIKKELKKQYPNDLDKYLDSISEQMAVGLKDNNKKFKNIATSILLFLFITLGVTIYIYLYQLNYKFSTLLKVIRNNLLLFISICMIEVLFFFLVILKYSPLQNKEFKEIFINSYNKKIDENRNIQNKNLGVNNIVKNLDIQQNYNY